MEQSERWNFAIVGCDSNNLMHYLGFVKTYEDAAKFGEDMKKDGWNNVAVFDASLQEVKKNPQADD